eukprot:6178640-Pleurochrysis_carterae.AAC.2
MGINQTARSATATMGATRHVPLLVQRIADGAHCFARPADCTGKQEPPSVLLTSASPESATTVADPGLEDRAYLAHKQPASPIERLEKSYTVRAQQQKYKT